MLRSLFQRIWKSNEKYDTWTRQQLIDRLTLLETRSTTTSKHLPRRWIDPSQYPQQRVAFKVAYIGWRYFGFAALKETQQTVEGQLFQALQKSQLIQDPDSCRFTRCGRTDRGVSGLGQVIALDVRQSKDPLKPIPYLETVNGLLPPDIRLWAWSPVATDFHARFDCRSRTYKYFFQRQGLDIEAMQLAANAMLGSHDFRHFCKLDPAKQTSYQRRLLSLTLQPITSGGSQTDAYEAVIQGSAFLWHQVRCIMSILFLVGQRLESPDIVRQLLNTDRLAGRPDYPLASELPLLLYDCQFDDLPWQHSPKPERLEQHWQDLWQDQWTRAQLYDTFASTITQPSTHTARPSSTVVLGAGKSLRTSRYRPLMERSLADSEQVKRAKYEAKKRLKQQGVTL
ncbi:tRNA pseudouridine synthase [Hesseltinella vesiculosa]|uniref:tRNA pseudouridine synthase n=1 Tax=Hesseltinella vesiculosa TaxID=101127 RepID=A0A1X2G7H6_9FUNG|nr:tRNA pseudouridine synthase [Hesseltinella vesiculosa]